MAKNAYTWIKLYTELLNDPRLASINERACWRYIQALLFAARDDTGGELTIDGEAVGIRELAWTLRVDVETLKADFDALVDAGFLILDDDIYIIADGWNNKGRAMRKSAKNGANGREENVLKMPPRRLSRVSMLESRVKSRP